MKKKVPAIEVPLHRYLTRKVIANDAETFGTKKQGIPYQSIFYKGFEVMKGRRRDILHRMKLMDKKDIENKTVLDMGGNIGLSSFLAVDFGAKKTVGVDISPKITTAAIRLNVSLFGYPSYFTSRNVSKVAKIGRFDTGFVFSLNAHVKNDKMLAANIKENIKHVVYFECHRGQDIPATIANIFRDVQFMGYNDNLRRKFYRCLL